MIVSHIKKSFGQKQTEKSVQSVQGSKASKESKAPRGLRIFLPREAVYDIYVGGQKKKTPT
jgi:hypothetical protein